MFMFYLTGEGAVPLIDKLARYSLARGQAREVPGSKLQRAFVVFCSRMVISLMGGTSRYHRKEKTEYIKETVQNAPRSAGPSATVFLRLYRYL